MKGEDFCLGSNQRPVSSRISVSPSVQLFCPPRGVSQHVTSFNPGRSHGGNKELALAKV